MTRSTRTTQEPDPAVPAGTGPRRRGPAGWQVTGLLRASHPRQTLLTAAGLAAAAALSGRPLREVGLVLATVLVGQLVLAWHNEIVDRERDARHGTPGKPLASGWVEPGNAWYAVAVAVLLLVPLAISHGVVAGLWYLISVAVGLLGNVSLRRTPLSFLPWAVVWGLYPFFLAAGGWAGEGTDATPTTATVVLAALLGIGVHVLRSLPGLVADHEDGWRSLPLLVALRTGATRLLVLAGAWTVVVLVVLLVVGRSTGLRA